MEWLNYHHLLYFWLVVREGGLSQAARKVRLSHSTLSGQIRTLEERLGQRLFERQGRRLVLTETGRTAYRYADEIFTLGRELLDTLHERPTGRPARVNIGVVDVVPKLVVHRLLEPVLALPDPVCLVCQEDGYERLLARLATHELDVVIGDAPLPPSVSVRAFNHLLCESGVTFFAAARHASLRSGFPRSLDGAPVLLPTESAPLRRELARWFDAQAIRPRVAGEFEDSALLKVFGAEGLGVFTAPTIVEDAVREQYGVRVIGRTVAIKERFYAITGERRIKHPAVVAISDAARAGLSPPPKERRPDPDDRAAPATRRRARGGSTRPRARRGA